MTDDTNARMRASAALRKAGIWAGAGLVFFAPLTGGAHDRNHWTVVAAVSVLLGALDGRFHIGESVDSTASWRPPAGPWSDTLGGGGQSVDDWYQARNRS